MHLEFNYKLFESGLKYKVVFDCSEVSDGVLRWVCGGFVYKIKHYRKLCDFNVTVRDLKKKGVLHELWY